MGEKATGDLVGRDDLLGALATVVRRAFEGQRANMLVAGISGMGKTSLVRAAASAASEKGARVGWGTCIEGGAAPGYWPWTQVLTGFLRSVGPDRARLLAGDDCGLLATIAGGFGGAPAVDASDRARLLLFDATARWLEALAGEQPVLVVLDDLQWADESSLALLDFVARAPQPAGVCVLGAYRHDELTVSAQAQLGTLVSHVDHVLLEGLDREAVHTLVQQCAGHGVNRSTTAAIHVRTGGHPFFVRELAQLADRTEPGHAEVPVAVRGAVERRIRRLPLPAQQALEAAAVAGVDVMPDVVASALGVQVLDLETATRPAVGAGILGYSDGTLRFSHDMFRETILALIDPVRRVELHRRVATALADRRTRAGDVAPAELAHHFTAAIPVDGTHRAVQWALTAAAADASALAFGEAAGHLRRLRAAVADAAAHIDDTELCDVLLAEADALARSGSTLDARGLLRMARDVADRCGDAARVAAAALAVADLGARFAVRRDDIVRELENALAVQPAGDPTLEAQLTATLARELQHSVPEDRHRAGPLSERALDLGRSTGNPDTLIACLLARHDVVWSPGTEVQRGEIAREIVAVAQEAGDDERHAEGLLLLTNALLEQGSSAFEATLDSCLAILDRLGQPRHLYTAETRRACVALLHGRLDEAADRIDGAAALGVRIREPDVENVRMSQRLELVRASGEPDELRDFAAQAVAHWTGAPVHAHAVAAGFLARSGDLDAARRHVTAVLDLGTWRADRSYLWNVFVRELGHAAIALGDSELCMRLLEDVEPLAGSCGVSGAMIAFAGSHAHTAALLAGAVGRPERSRALIGQACAVYERVQATMWAAEARARMAAPEKTAGRAALRRRGATWHILYGGLESTVPHVKGLTDIAKLVSRPNQEVHVLELMEVTGPAGRAGEMADRQALDSYRRKLADLQDELDEASLHNDVVREARLSAEREALMEEIVRVTGVGGRARQFANHPAERARKAVAARVRDAIKKLEAEMPELASHLEQTIVTGTYCRYRGGDSAWEVDN